ncbi:uncharacterized protein LOC126417100 [Schistocerca serialis cubense]|uniref:uncharacterized protein LOC126417100 n=1 Tax=Schistocerca serialis cubense TaxID=2023355 RepID=UPI00214F20C0|nr:uncharacterized protein LOC126417100 [Schistocerca serialis cubense]
MVTVGLLNAPFSAVHNNSSLVASECGRNVRSPLLSAPDSHETLLLFAGVGGLRDVSVNIPLAVAPGDTVKLTCLYDLEGDPLYTVKWYKGRQEFFRYVPKELPHTRVFPLPGVNVDIGQSNAHQVVLRDVQLELAGKYRCEVSADAPSFHTQVVASHMHVVYQPEGEPRMFVEKPRYAVGDTLRANCSAPASSPPVNLTWFLNDRKINETFLERHEVRTSAAAAPGSAPGSGGGGLQPASVAGGAPQQQQQQQQPPQQQTRYVTVIGLEMDVGSDAFRGGKLRLACRGALFGLYRQQALRVIDEERPRLASVLGTRESSATGAGVSAWGRPGWLLLLATGSLLALLSLSR